MTPTEICITVRSLQAQGHSLREISRLLALSRNTVRRILRARRCCMDRGWVAKTPNPICVHPTRTESGRPNSSIRFRT
jgi:lambda repressor-like predicted transcriptional regulator